jgi:hypothetical protein
MGAAGDIEVQVGNVTLKNQSRTALLAKYAPNGSVIWTRPYYLSYEPPLGEPFTIQLEAGPGGDLYMYGTPFLGISDVSPAPEISIWGQYSYVTRLTRDGDIRWTALTPFMGRSPYHLLVSPTGDSYLANYTSVPSAWAYHISPNGAQVTQIPHQSGYEPFLMEDTALYIGYGSRLNISCALGGETLAGAYHLGRITGGVLADSTTVLSYGTYHSLKGVNEYGFLVFAPGYVSVTSNGLDRLATSIHAEQLLLNDTRLITGDYNIVGELTYPFIPVSNTLQPVCYTSPNGWSTTYKDWILLAPVPADQYVEARIIIHDTPYFKTNQVPDPAIPMQLSLYDLSMREQVRDIFTSEDPVITRTLDVSSLTPGVYILTLTRGGIRTWSGKLYVRH